MSEWVGRLWEGFSGQYRHDKMGSARIYAPLDLDKIAKGIKLERIGRQRGEQELPKSDQDALDECENAIVARISNEARDASGTFLESMRAYADRQAALDIGSRSVAIRGAVQGAIADLERSFHTGANQLYRLRKDLLAAERDLERFRKRHRLEREANYPESWLWHFGFLFFLFAIETGLNGSILGGGHELGIIGGWGLAVVIGVLNVFLLGLIGAQAVRCLVFRNIAAKLAGLVLLAAFLSGIAALSLAGAHLRQALKAGEQDYAKAAIESLLATPLEIGDLISWFFVAMTVAFAVGAAIDFLKMTDLYYGYAAVDKRLRRCEEDYADEKEALIEEMTEIRDDRVESMKAQRQALIADKNHWETMINSAMAMRRDHETHLTYLEDCVNRLLSIYREANKAARKTPAPSHFDERWRMKRPDDMSGPLNDLDVEGTKRAIAETDEALGEGIEKVEATYREHIKKYERIETLQREEVEREQKKLEAA